MPFQFTKLEIPEVILIKPIVFSDNRGIFMETYKSTDFLEAGVKGNFLQDNYSKSAKKGTLRGLHYQKEPKAQSKLIRVIKGSVFDVAIDIRKNSPTYGKWVSVILSAENKEMLYIPKGFAHGLCTLEDDTEIVYKCTNEYSSEHNKGITWDDPIINIEWPAKKPILSKRDSSWPSLAKVDNDFIYG